MKKITITNLIGFIFTSVVGTLLHFTYDFFGGNAVAVFSAVNESTFEHLKLLFWPFLLFSVLEYLIYGKEYQGFLPIKVFSVLAGIISIVVLFYTYKGILGYSLAPVDISIFFIATAFSYILSVIGIRKNAFNSNTALAVSAVMLAIMMFCFIFFTFNPPHIGLFYDYAHKIYGKK